MRIGIILDNFQWPAWVELMVGKILALASVSISLLVLPSEVASAALDHRRGGGGFFQMYNRLDRSLARRIQDGREADALQLCDASSLLAGIPVCRVAVNEKDDGAYIADDDLKGIENLGLDVLVNLGSRQLRGPILRAAKWGVWETFFGEPGKGSNMAKGFFEVTRGYPVTVSGVWIRQGPESGHKVVYRSSAQTYHGSITESNNAIFWKSSSFIPRLLSKAARSGVCPEKMEVVREKPAPGNMSAALLLAWYWGRRVRNKVRTSFVREEWTVLTRPESGLSRSWKGFVPVLSPPGRFWADPFLLANNGNVRLFMEEFVYSEHRGRIVTAEVDPQGRVGLPVPILERQYHISYPFVFQWEGKTYMIPETANNRTIDLYSSSGDLTNWQFVMTLMEGVKAYDTTLYHDGKRWWLMTCMAENPGGTRFDELFLFSAEQLETKEWRPHPRNPVVSDVTHARPAGAVFSMNGKVYRPAQDCSRRYGWNVMLCEVVTLNEHEYVEIPRPFVESPKPWGMVAAHTLCRTDGLTVIDAKRTHWRFAAGFAVLFGALWNSVMQILMES
jgi:hypothetical protein